MTISKCHYYVTLSFDERQLQTTLEYLASFSVDYKYRGCYFKA